MSHKDFQSWLNEVMSKIIESLGLDVNKVQYEASECNGLFIMSNLYHICLQFENKTNGQNEELFMILKRPMLGFSQAARIDLQFHNEILFYQSYSLSIPRSDEVYARCIYAEERPPIDSVIALENINKRGYYSCPCLYDPPMEYTLAAIRELGRFHGKGYAMKELQRDKFFGIVEQIQEVRYEKRKGNTYEFITNIEPMRAVDYLRSQDYDANFCDKMEICFSNVFDAVMRKTIQPREPLATLCHGDFTLSNILFKTEDDGQYRPMLIDFALITYSTPVVDLSTYLHLCCSNEMRREKFSEIMRAYHDALQKYLLDVGIQDIERYSYNALLDDFRRGALFGFIIMCCFLPTILGHLSPEVVVQEILDLGPVESSRKHKHAGGDEISKILADALLYLRDIDCLNHIL